jgi:hypothetical protein
MRVLPKLAITELNGVRREDGLGVEGSAGHALTERAITGKRT